MINRQSTKGKIGLDDSENSDDFEADDDGPD